MDMGKAAADVFAGVLTAARFILRYRAVTRRVTGREYRVS
jgi:hypothetical protein